MKSPRCLSPRLLFFFLFLGHLNLGACSFTPASRDASFSSLDFATGQPPDLHAFPSPDMAMAGTTDAAGAPDLTLTMMTGRDWTRYPAVYAQSGAADIYAMGDVHGDPAAMVKVLKGAGLISGTGPYKWSGGKVLLVVTGDVIDKGTMALAAIDILSAIEADAMAQGGRVVVTLGNHEAEFLADPMGTKTQFFQSELTNAGLDPVKVAAGDSPYGAWLRTRPVAALVDEWFFSHAGDTVGKSAVDIATLFQNDFIQGNLLDPYFTGTTGPLESKQNWWGSGTMVLDQNLAALPAKHIVYGHQPNKVPCPAAQEGDRPTGTLATCYAGRLFMEDIGMSSAVSSNPNGGILHIHRGSPSTVEAVLPDGTKLPIWKG